MEEAASDLNNMAELFASNKYNTGLKHDPMSLMSQNFLTFRILDFKWVKETLVDAGV